MALRLCVGPGPRWSVRKSQIVNSAPPSPPVGRKGRPPSPPGGRRSKDVNQSKSNQIQPNQTKSTIARSGFRGAPCHMANPENLVVDEELPLMSNITPIESTRARGYRRCRGPSRSSFVCRCSGNRRLGLWLCLAPRRRCGRDPISYRRASRPCHRQVQPGSPLLWTTR